jgi:hypothetical protein
MSITMIAYKNVGEGVCDSITKVTTNNMTATKTTLLKMVYIQLNK